MTGRSRWPHPAARPARRRRESGAATAELALVMPVLAAATIGLVWFLAVGAAQVRMVDAARETARAAARGDDDAAAIARGREVAPEASTISLVRTGEEVRVTASGRVAGPGGLFDFLPGVRLEAEAVAAAEEQP